MVTEKMIVSLIVAISKNFAIGKNNNLLWHLPEDMKYFKTKTLNHHIITGRKNYISIPKKFRPLKNRTNIVLTKQPNFKEAGCIICHRLADAINTAKKNNEKEVFIIGGGQIYKEALAKNLVDKMYITHINENFEADTFFPKFEKSNWKKVSEKIKLKDSKHLYDYTFAVYEKMI